jgi:hypothetical protein
VSGGKRTTPRPHRPDEGLGRSREGPTCRVHLSGVGGRHPLTSSITPGQWGDAPQFLPVGERIRIARLDGGRPRTRPGRPGGDKAYFSRRNRRYLRRRRIEHTRPRTKEPACQPSTKGQRRRPTRRLRQVDPQAKERSRADGQRVEEFPGRGHEVRQARLRPPRHRHGRPDPTSAPPVTGRRSCRRASRAGCPGGRCGGPSPR